MKIMLDTNIIISAALFPHGKIAQAFFKALSGGNKPVMCDYIVDELHRKFREKFPERLTELEAFLFNALQYINLVPTPESETEPEKLIRDSILILKILKTLWIRCNFGEYGHKNAEITTKITGIIPRTNREGGRTVGSGRVTSIIE